MDPMNIAVVGLNFGRHIVREITEGEGAEHLRLAAVCDLREDVAQEVAREKGVKAYSELEEVLGDPDIPAVGLFTGPEGRADLIRRIIYAGKDVLTTKPFELDPDAALKVLREARELGRVVHLNSPAPLAPPDLAQIQAWVRQYELGRPVACRADVWVSYREKADGRWLDAPDKCPVAPIFRLGIYLINDLVCLFGPAVKVQVLHSRIFTGRPTPDNAQLGILFQNGALANVYASFCIDDKQYYQNSLVLNYQSGTVYRNIGPLENPMESDTTQLSLAARNGEETNLTEFVTLDGHPGVYQWEAFVRAVRGEKLADEVTPEQIVAGLKVIHAMARADKSGKTEAVD
jgi:predicted dehydrogenase